MQDISTEPWKTIIPIIPIGEHSAEIKSKNWKILPEPYSQDIFGDNPTIPISRKRLLENKYKDDKIKCIEILMWGYPSGGRGHLREKFLNNLNRIAELANANTEWHEYYSNLHAIGGLGISTITKLSYFFNKKFKGKQSLIIDTRVIEVLKSGRWKGLAIPGITYDNAHKKYQAYLNMCDELASKLKCKADRIEFFLFFMGNSF